MQQKGKSKAEHSVKTSPTAAGSPSPPTWCLDPQAPLESDPRTKRTVPGCWIKTSKFVSAFSGFQWFLVDFGGLSPKKKKQNCKKKSLQFFHIQMVPRNQSSDPLICSPFLRVDILHTGSTWHLRRANAVVWMILTLICCC